MEDKDYVAKQLRLAEALRNVPPNVWVALSEDESQIIATAGTPGEASALAREAGVAHPVIMTTPPDWGLLIA